MFPYCARNVEDFLQKRIDNAQFQPIIQALIDDSARQNQPDPQTKIISDSKDYKTLAENVRHFIQKDLKVFLMREA